ncbi:MAG: family 65 glycosyl hydrolase [Treponema sp.]|jgi:maltose phosphorylase|nr:family 65 glycosyl hydrolase [Treponema sp.]
MGKHADTYLVCDPWKIIEDDWHPERNLVSESIFSLGNEYMGVRGCADEEGSVESLRGSYFNGIYEEEDTPGTAYKGIVTKTHFMVNAVDWLSTEIRVTDETLDMGRSKIARFRRELDMRKGTFTRSFDWILPDGRTVGVSFLRFLNMEQAEEGFQRVSLTLDTGSAEASVRVANSFNTLHGWNKKCYWNAEQRDWFETGSGQGAAIQAVTVRTGQRIFSGFVCGASSGARFMQYEADKTAGYTVTLPLSSGREAWVEKKVCNLAEKTPNEAADALWDLGVRRAAGVRSFAKALKAQEDYWARVWDAVDIRIEGDELNQQGIRFCIFQMRQTYHGYDPSNNIGAKGLTGEAYNGHTFWDTETYCLPFYLFSNLKAARNLLDYRYATLAQARIRARQLDCQGACYPVATLNGEEGCNLWQHASLQFQASTAVAYGIAHYVRVSGDMEFLHTHGAEMLVEISRFLACRGAWNKNGFGFYAVMGPDEFHLMVNHNCYTNFMAKKTFEYTGAVLADMEQSSPADYAALAQKTGLSPEERAEFIRCAEKMILLFDQKTKLFEQHEGYFDLPHIEISQIPVSDFPLYYHWSYDRIYRTDMIKQPDVLMFLFLYNQEFSPEVKKINYETYEPHTIHESSLSPSIHSIFAAELGKSEEAFRFFGFATRMDLDNYNRNTAEGLHTTSIAAAWMNIVYGFGGLRSDGDVLVCNPTLPARWESYEFRILYRGARIRVRVGKKEVVFSAVDTDFDQIPLVIYGRPCRLDSKGLTIPRAQTPETP